MESGSRPWVYVTLLCGTISFFLSYKNCFTTLQRGKFVSRKAVGYCSDFPLHSLEGGDALSFCTMLDNGIGLNARVEDFNSYNILNLFLLSDKSKPWKWAKPEWNCGCRDWPESYLIQCYWSVIEVVSSFSDTIHVSIARVSHFSIP